MAMKKTTVIMKSVLVILMFISWASFTQAQTAPDISVYKLVDGSETDISNNPVNYINAGQKDTFKIIISEPSQEQSDFFSNPGQLKVFLPDDAGVTWDDALQFGNNHGNGNSDNDLVLDVVEYGADIALTYNNLSTNKDTICIDIAVDNTDEKQDEIVIENLIIEFPDDLADGDDFELKAWADFMDTSGDGAADTTEFELVNFKYTKPLLSITKQSTACYGEKVVCDLDITPDTLRYNLMVNDGLHKKVTHGDTAHFSYNDDVYLKDP